MGLAKPAPHVVRLAVVVIAVSCAQLFAQPASRFATTMTSLRTSPVFFHGKQVAVLGSVNETREGARLEPESGAAPGDAASAGTKAPIFVFFRERPSRSSGEVRGEFWDLGRLTEGDTRFSNYDFKPLLEATTQGRWPSRDQVFVLLGASMIETKLPDAPTLRAIVLAPDRYEGKSVTISGRFRGRNLYGDLATPLSNSSKWDFVMQSADAAVWISNLRPKGKGFELDPGARLDTGRWVQVAGIVRRDGGRPWIEGREIEQVSAPEETTAEVVVPLTAPEPPPTIVFTTPVPDEPDVDVATPVRIQFSRDMDGRTFKGRVRITYLPSAQAGAELTPPTYTPTYNVGNRGLEIKFAKPLERFQKVSVELLEGITTIMGDPLKPWSMTFTTGGR
jgi:Big-like domain-containing protein